MNNKCTNCGAYNLDVAQFCAECGCKLESTHPGETRDFSEQDYSKSHTSGSIDKKPYILFGIVVAVIGLTVLLYPLLKETGTSSNYPEKGSTASTLTSPDRLKEWNPAWPAISSSEWEKTFGGLGRDEGLSVMQTSDLGFIITGAINYISVLVKTDPSGNLVWQQTYKPGWGAEVLQTSDGGYAFVGFTTVRSPYADLYLAKTDAYGNLEWDRIIGGNDEERGESLGQTTDGGFIIVGRKDSRGAPWSDVYLVKTSAMGEITWEKMFGGNDFDEGKAVKQTSDGGYIITGSKGKKDSISSTYLLRTDESGNLIWEKTLAGSTGSSVVETRDAGFVVCGEGSIKNRPGLKAFLAKTNGGGHLQWQRFYGPDAQDIVQPMSVGGNLVTLGGTVGRSVLLTKDGGYVFTGFISGVGAGHRDVLIMKTDADGDPKWYGTFGEKDEEEAYSLDQCSDGSYIISGFTSSRGRGARDIYLIRTNTETSFFRSNGTTLR